MSEPWTSADRIVEQLGVTKVTADSWKADRGMPPHKAGRLGTFEAGELDAWVRGGGSAGGVA